MDGSANDYTMQDQSSKPYAWTIEGVDAADVRKIGVEEWVKSYVMNIIPVSAELQGIAPDVTIEEIYAALEEGGEITDMVSYIRQWLDKN